MTFFIILWGVIAVAAIIVEAFTTELVSIWFAPAAIVALLLASFDVKIWLQCVVFFVVTVLCLLLFRVLLKKHIKAKPYSPTNYDALIGEKAIVIVPIDNIKAQGQVKVKGQIWSAKSKDPSCVIDVNTTVTIVDIQGVKLICEI